MLRPHTVARDNATWWLLEQAPYVVYGEVPLSNGRVRKMTEVALPR